MLRLYGRPFVAPLLIFQPHLTSKGPTEGRPTGAPASVLPELVQNIIAQFAGQSGLVIYMTSVAVTGFRQLYVTQLLD